MIQNCLNCRYVILTIDKHGNIKTLCNKVQAYISDTKKCKDYIYKKERIEYKNANSIR